VYAPAALVVAACWLRLESPRSAAEPIALLLLALLPALAPSLRLRLGAAVLCALAAVRIALDVSPFDEETLGQRLGDGVLEFYDVSLPFRPGEHPDMHGALLVGIFAAGLALSLAIAARRPFLAVLAIVVGAGWPATLVEGSGELALGTAILAAALWLLTGLREHSPHAALPAALAGVVLVAAAAGATTSDAVAKGAMLDWERWDLYDAPLEPVGVDYVWDAQYDGIDFPDKRTVVLRVTAPRRALYWRATTLDTYTGERWLESLVPVVPQFQGGRLPRDPLVAAPPTSQWVRQEVEVVGLRDDHLVAAATPVQLRPERVGRVVLLNGGIARVERGLAMGQRYVAWSAVRRPTAAQLANLPARYPSAVQNDLDVDPRVRMLAFRDAGRPDQLRELLSGERASNITSYRPLVETALRVTQSARTPYAAVVALEDWFRSVGGFRYEEQPQQTGTAPPLVEFVTRTKAGYCQHFAGAMALMLRFLGIPARVAVGFTSGRFRDGTWTVTDHDAHAWVEVWFPGHGWLSFDPTPGRGTLSAAYTLASDSPSDIQATREALQGIGGGLDPSAGGPTFGTGAGGALDDDGRPWDRLPLVVLGLVLLLVGVGLVKLVVRRLRYLTADPRRRATAARRELADFLRDQRLEVTPAATLEELQHVLATELGVDGRRFAAAAGAARYGPPPGVEAAARRARRELRSLLRALRKRLTAGERLRGWLAIRSLRRA
jgi:transglutaminase-like putative cysteine protease